MTGPKVGIYTAIYGVYDWVKPAPAADVPKLLFTDNPDIVDEAWIQGWEPRLVPHSITTLNGDVKIVEPMLNHKYWKTHPALVFPDMDYSIWVDGSIQVTVPDIVNRYLGALGQDDWSCVPHPARKCIFDEATYSATLIWRYDKDAISNQSAHYANWHPKGWGLIATGTNIRRHTSKVIELCDQWWVENLNWSHQDQLSLPVLLRLYQNDVKFNQNLTWHKDWVLHPHGSRG